MFRSTLVSYNPVSMYTKAVPYMTLYRRMGSQSAIMDLRVVLAAFSLPYS